MGSYFIGYEIRFFFGYTRTCFTVFKNSRQIPWIFTMKKKGEALILLFFENFRNFEVGIITMEKQIRHLWYLNNFLIVLK